jgi:membrane-associated phospholipid phosphatase
MLDKAIISFFKLAYHHSRPWVISSNIIPISCSKEYGNPSGHASASTLFSLFLILDTFHGRPLSSDQQGNPLISFRYKITYFLCIILGLYWTISISYCRFLLGAHSLDQIIYGITLGIWEALTAHFLIRDNIITFLNISKFNVKI